MKERDEDPDLIDRLAKDEPSNALKVAIRQTTQQCNGNHKVLLPLKEHLEVLERFGRKKAEWKTKRNGVFFATLETFTYCLASSFKLYRATVIQSTLKNESVKKR